MGEFLFKPINGKSVRKEIFGTETNLQMSIEGSSPDAVNWDPETKLAKIIQDFTRYEWLRKLCIQSGYPEVPRAGWRTDNVGKLIDKVSHPLVDTIHIAGVHDEYLIYPNQSLVSPGFYGCQAVLASSADILFFKHNLDVTPESAISFLDKVQGHGNEVDEVIFLANQRHIVDLQIQKANQFGKFKNVRGGVVSGRPFRFWTYRSNSVEETHPVAWAVTAEEEGRNPTPKTLPVTLTA